MSRWSRCLQATLWQMVGKLTQPRKVFLIFPDQDRRIYIHQASGCILHTRDHIICPYKLHLAGQLWSGLFLGWASNSLQDPSGFCKDQTSKLNRDMLGTHQACIFKSSTNFCHLSQGLHHFLFTIFMERGQFWGFLLGLPHIDSSYQQVQCVVYFNHHICQSQLYIGGLGKWVPDEFPDQVDPDFC